MNTIFQVMTLAWSLQGGVLPDIATSSQIKDVLNIGPVLFAEYGFELTYPIFTGNKSDSNGFYLGTVLRNEFKPSNSAIQFDPIQDTYTFTGGVRWNELTLGYEHVCTHSVENMLLSDIVSQRLFGSTDRIYVQIKGSI